MPQTILFHDTIVARNQSFQIDFPIKRLEDGGLSKPVNKPVDTVRWLATTRNSCKWASLEYIKRNNNNNNNNQNKKKGKKNDNNHSSKISPVSIDQFDNTQHFIFPQRQYFHVVDHFLVNS